MLSWYAIYVNVKHEKKVIQKLEELNIKAYSPFVRRLQQWSDRKRWVDFPMISGYVFVNIEEADKKKVLSCSGVFSFIRFNGKEAKIQDSEISILKSIEKSGYDATQVTEELELSHEVEIMQGPLKGLRGTIIQLQNASCIQIHLENLQQNIKVNLPKHILKIVHEKANDLSKHNSEY